MVCPPDPVGPPRAGPHSFRAAVAGALDALLLADDEGRQHQAHSRELEEKTRLLDAAARIGRAVLTVLEQDVILDRLGEEVLRAGLFRSLCVAVVRHGARTVEVIRGYQARPASLDASGRRVYPNEDGSSHEFPAGSRLLDESGGRWLWEDEDIIGLTYPLDDGNITARVARTGRFEVVDEWSDDFDPRVDRPEDRRGKCSFFMPLVHGGRALAVLATGCELADRAATLHRLEILQPLLDQAAVALHHAQLYEESQRHAASLSRLNRQLQTQIEERLRAEGDMRDERDRAETYLHLAGVMFIALDPHGRVALANPKAAEVLGCEVGQIVGRDWFGDFLPEESQDFARGVFAGLMAGEDMAYEHAESLVVAADGARRLISWHNTALRDRDGTIVGTLASGEDITERSARERAVQESEARYRTLFEGSSSPIAILDRDARYLMVNSACAAILGADPAAVLGKPVAAYMPSQHDITVQRVRQVLDEDRPLLVEECLEVLGAPRWFLSSLQPLRDAAGTPIACQVMSHDITERKQAEARLAQENEFHLAESAVRMAIAEMDDPEHLRQVVRELSRQLRRLGVDHEAATMDLVNDAGTDFIVVGRGPDEPWPGFERLSAGDWGDPTGNAETYPWVLQVWRDQVSRYQPAGPEHIPRLAGKALLDVPFSRGTLGLRAAGRDAFPPAHIAIVERFAQILSQGYQRVSDIVERQRAESALAWDREAELAEAAVRVAIANMDAGSGLQSIVAEIGRQLESLGVDHDAVGIQVVNLAGSDFYSVSSDTLGGERETALSSALLTRDWAPSEPLAHKGPWVIEAWRSGQTVYQPRAPDTVPAVAGRSLLDAPFSHGTLAVNSRRPHAFTPEHITLVERLAGVLSDGFQRFLDLAQRHAAQLQLAASEGRYRTLLATVPDALAIFDAHDGHLVEVNEAACTMYGYSRQEFLQLTISDISAEPDASRASMAAILPGGGVYTSVWRHRRRDGSEFSVEVSGGLVQLADRQLLMGVYRDITERLEGQEKLRHYSRRSVQATESERRRIARELHDGVNQILSGAKLRLDASHSRLIRLDRQAAGDVSDADDMLADAIREVRRISRDLRPGVLDDLGLAPALRSLARQVSEPSGLLVDLHCPPDLPHLPEEIGSALYRIVQEAVANAQRHARARAVRIALSLHRRRIHLEVEDDGAGFDLDQVRATSPGVGLHSMEERALLLGGTFQLRSGPGRGTVISVTLPLTA